MTQAFNLSQLANNVNSSGVLAESGGGTGKTTLFNNTNTWGNINTFTGGVAIGSATSSGPNSITSAAYNYTAYTSTYYSSGAQTWVVNVSTSGSNTVFSCTANTAIVGSNYWLISASDGQANLGGPSNRWNTVYATNGTINTSDATEKQQIAELTDAEKAVAKSIKGLFKTFKFNDAVAKKGENARIHVGVIAQDVKAAFEAQGLDPTKYGIFCSDTWEDKPELLSEEGGLIMPAIKGNTRLGVRYDELLAFVISAL
jgi:hypothetical protein